MVAGCLHSIRAGAHTRHRGIRAVESVGQRAPKWPRNELAKWRESRSFLVFPSLLTSMLPFAQEKRRKINLGGATSVASQTDLLHSAKARRNEREEIRRRHESARCIQSRWRSSQKSRAVKHILEERFQEDVLGLNGMRALVLIGRNESLLAQWSEAVVSAGDGKPSVYLMPVPRVSRKHIYISLFPLF